VSDFVHDPNPTVAVINQPEGSVTVTTENSDFMHKTAEQSAEEMTLKQEHANEVAELNEKHAEENAKIEEGEPLEPVEVVPYRASTPESDKANVDQLLEEGKITEEEHKDRVAEIAKIARDETLTPKEPKPEPVPKAEKETDSKKEADTHKDAVKK